MFLLAGIFVGWSAERLRTLLLATLAVSAAGAVVLVLYVAGGGHNPILPVALTFSDGDHSISMGRQMAAGLLVALAIVLGGGDRSARLVAAGSMPLLVTALIASGARGPVVALLAGAAALMLLGIQERAARRRLVVIALAVATAGAMVQVVVPQTSVVRSFSFASTDVEGTSSGRTEMWAQALRAFREHPELGIGTGGFAEVNPPMIYPHNLLLEVGAELGIAGVLLVLGLLGHAVVRLGRAHLRAGRRTASRSRRSRPCWPRRWPTRCSPMRCTPTGRSGCGSVSGPRWRRGCCATAPAHPRCVRGHEDRVHRTLERDARRPGAGEAARARRRVARPRTRGRALRPRTGRLRARGRWRASRRPRGDRARDAAPAPGGPALRARRALRALRAGRPGAGAAPARGRAARCSDGRAGSSASPASSHGPSRGSGARSA